MAHRGRGEGVGPWMLEIGETWSVVDRQSERGEEEQEDGWDEGGCLSTSGDDKYYQQGVEGRQRERERGGGGVWNGRVEISLEVVVETSLGCRWVAN